MPTSPRLDETVGERLANSVQMSVLPDTCKRQLQDHLNLAMQPAPGVDAARLNLDLVGLGQNALGPLSALLVQFNHVDRLELRFTGVGPFSVPALPRRLKTLAVHAQGEVSLPLLNAVTELELRGLTALSLIQEGAGQLQMVRLNRCSLAIVEGLRQRWGTGLIHNETPYPLYGDGRSHDTYLSPRRVTPPIDPNHLSPPSSSRGSRSMEP